PSEVVRRPVTPGRGLAGLPGAGHRGSVLLPSVPCASDRRRSPERSGRAGEHRRGRAKALARRGPRRQRNTPEATILSASWPAPSRRDEHVQGPKPERQPGKLPPIRGRTPLGIAVQGSRQRDTYAIGVPEIPPDVVSRYRRSSRKEWSLSRWTR